LLEFGIQIGTLSHPYYLVQGDRRESRRLSPWRTSHGVFFLYFDFIVYYAKDITYLY